MNPELAGVSGSSLPQSNSNARAIKDAFVSRKSPVSCSFLFAVCLHLELQQCSWPLLSSDHNGRSRSDLLLGLAARCWSASAHWASSTYQHQHIVGSLTGVIGVTPLVLTPSASLRREPPRWVHFDFAGGLLFACYGLSGAARLDHPPRNKGGVPWG